MPSFSSTSVACLLLLLLSAFTANGFSVVFMARRGKGGLKKNLNDEGKANVKAANQGRGQEITGVTLPAEGKVRGWEFGEGVQMACANVDGNLYALEGQCPRCAFDLFKGDVIADDAAFEELPRLACPTCSITYSLRTGKRGPAIKRTGLQAFVGNLAKSATESEGTRDAKCFQISRDEEGRVFCREK